MRKLLCLAFLALAAAGALGQVVRIVGATRVSTCVVATNALVASTAPTQLFSVTAENSSGSDLWLLVFDATSLPANGTAPTLAPVKITAGATGGYDFNIAGCHFSNGIVAANSTTDRALTNGGAVFWITVTHDPRPN